LAGASAREFDTKDNRCNVLPNERGEEEEEEEEEEQEEEEEKASSMWSPLLDPLSDKDFNLVCDKHEKTA
jgi:hypothetical protein